MKRFGLLGKKLGHSFSPQIHAMLGDYEYRLYELESEELIPDFIKTSDLDGFNVTIPYKQAVIPYLDELTPAASEIGAVNTVCRRDGRLIGDNTDCVGFAYTVASSGADVRGKKTLVIGNGGASKAVCHALRAAGADVNLLTHKENTAEGIKPYLDSRIIVNTTPVGMFPKNGEAPVDISLFGECEYVFDIIFNPAKTALMLEAEKRGIPCRNGLPMLVSQAKRAAELFMECEIADSEYERTTEKKRAASYSSDSTTSEQSSAASEPSASATQAYSTPAGSSRVSSMTVRKMRTPCSRNTVREFFITCRRAVK